MFDLHCILSFVHLFLTHFASHFLIWTLHLVLLLTYTSVFAIYNVYFLAAFCRVLSILLQAFTAKASFLPSWLTEKVLERLVQTVPALLEQSVVYHRAGF